MSLEYDPEALPTAFTPGLVWLKGKHRHTDRFFADREWQHNGNVLVTELYSGQTREWPAHRVRSVILHETTETPERGVQYLDSAEKIDIIRDKYGDGGDTDE